MSECGAGCVNLTSVRDIVSYNLIYLVFKKHFSEKQKCQANLALEGRTKMESVVCLHGNQAEKCP